MSDLRDLFNDLRYIDAITLLQSDNVVLETGRSTGAAQEACLETETS